MKQSSIHSVDWPLWEMPRIRVAGRFPLQDQNFSYRYFSSTHSLHIHDYAGTIRIEDRELALRPGDLTLSPARKPSWYHLPQPGHHWCVHFHVARSRGGRSAARLPIHLSLGAAASFAVERLTQIARLFHSRGDNVEGSHAAASAALQALLLWIAQREVAPATTGPAPDAIDRAASILEANFPDSPGVPDLADAVGLSQNYLARKFKRRFGMTISRYVLTRRINHACHLLGNTDIPIQRVAMRIGVPDLQYFNKLFRKFAGTSPSAYRRGCSR